MGLLKQSDKQQNNGELGDYFDMSSRIGLSKKLPFLVVQEGIWKNQATERVRAFLATKFGDRAEVELRYIRLLQDWLDDLDPPRDNNDASDSYMDSLVVKAIVGCLKNEATAQIEARQKVYNAIMNDLGPYSAIRREVVSHNKGLDWVVEKFKLVSEEDKKCEKEHRLHTEKKEHIANQVEAIESQLSQRSRITSARRAGRQGQKKKIDAMRNRASFLRNQLKEEEEMILLTQKELLNLETKATGELGKMESVLKELEKIRVQNIMQQTRLFMEAMLNTQTHTRRSANSSETLRLCLKDVTEAEKRIDKNWEDVEANALRAQAGQAFKLRQLFEVPPKRSKSADSRKSIDSARIAEIEANRLIELDVKATIQDSLISDNARQQKLPVSTKTSLHGSPVSEESSERSSSDDDRREFTPKFAKERIVKEVISDTSIENLDLPPETRNGARGTPPPTTVRKNIWLTTPEPGHVPEEVEETGFTRVSDMDGTESPMPRIFSRSGHIDVGQFRDIRVKAVHDYTATAPGELSFKKGQVIKQKAGENERGFCYGWTRDHLLFPKRYGFYPKTAVCIEGFLERRQK